MTVMVMSRNDAWRYSLQSWNETCAMVSIRSPGMEDVVRYPERRNSIAAMLPIAFADVVDSDPKAHGITTADAEKIADFVLEHWEKVDVLIVHCDAGVSRSAGVAAAILKVMTGSDMQIFGSFCYRPNMLCYRRVYEALLQKQSQ